MQLLLNKRQRLQKLASTAQSIIRTEAERTNGILSGTSILPVQKAQFLFLLLLFPVLNMTPLEQLLFQATDFTAKTLLTCAQYDSLRKKRIVCSSICSQRQSRFSKQQQQHTVRILWH